MLIQLFTKKNGTIVTNNTIQYNTKKKRITRWKYLVLVIIGNWYLTWSSCSCSSCFSSIKRKRKRNIYIDEQHCFHHQHHHKISWKCCYHPTRPPPLPFFFLSSVLLLLLLVVVLWFCVSCYHHHYHRHYHSQLMVFVLQNLTILKIIKNFIIQV